MKITINSIKIRPDRQRKDLGDLSELKKSILNVGTLINPVVIEQDSTDGLFYLIAGERRLTAWRALFEDGLISEEIPATLFSELDESARQLIELEENIKRKDLTWQERVDATMKLAGLKNFPSDVEFAEYLGVSTSTISRTRALWESRDDEKIWGAENFASAYTIYKRESARVLASAKSDLNYLISDFMQGENTNDNSGKSGGEYTESSSNLPREIKVESGTASSSSGSSSYESRGLSFIPSRKVSSEELSQYRIINEDFFTWAENYKGKPFNFFHFDFPYGINHDRSKQGNTATFGTYADSEDIYKALVRGFLENQDKLSSQNAHCVCWLSLNFLEWTKEQFKSAGWDCHLQPFIWHKSDNKGILADTKCGMRNVGEYALIFNRGRMPVVKNISNIFASPTTKKFHASEKPLPVLNYLFSAFCDKHSRVLDPTCGSGTAIQVAMSYGAEEALGIELDKEFSEKANQWLEDAKTDALSLKNLELKI